jgi:histidinol dehydrogenase
MKIYSKEEASKTILLRSSNFEERILIQIRDSIKKIFGKVISPEEVVRLIVNDVKKRKDLALTDWTHKLDKVSITQFELREKDFTKYLLKINPKLRRALEIAYKRILSFHKSQPITSWINNDLGGFLGQFITPIQKIGIYVPGGQTPLFSSVLMIAIPAIVAGTKEMIFTTPPDKNGEISPKIVAACGMIQSAGIKVRLFKLGGAQAIAALAYGTTQIPKVDKIYGPGNIFVSLAKKQVFGTVGIDGIYGPTEAMIIADETAKPRLIASDLLAQAEHDYLAIPILLTHVNDLIVRVQEELETQLTQMEKKDVIEKSIKTCGGIIQTNSLEESIQISNEFAPEHLSLLIKSPFEVISQIKNAGAVFLGEDSFEVLGDYIAGPSHVMPTNGSARFSSPLSVIDFIKATSFFYLTKPMSENLSGYAETLALNEGLIGHANAVIQRKKKEGGIRAERI